MPEKAKRICLLGVLHSGSLSEQGKQHFVAMFTQRGFKIFATEFFYHSQEYRDDFRTDITVPGSRRGRYTNLDKRDRVLSLQGQGIRLEFPDLDESNPLSERIILNLEEQDRLLSRVVLGQIKTPLQFTQLCDRYVLLVRFGEIFNKKREQVIAEQLNSYNEDSVLSIGADHISSLKEILDQNMNPHEITVEYEPEVFFSHDDRLRLGFKMMKPGEPDPSELLVARSIFFRIVENVLDFGQEEQTKEQSLKVRKFADYVSSLLDYDQIRDLICNLGNLENNELALNKFKEKINRIAQG